jgi:hypothetical protein
MSDSPEPGDEPWDAAFAADLIGKTLRVGLTHLDASGSVVEQVVIEASLDFRHHRHLPGRQFRAKVHPDLSAIVAAEPAGRPWSATFLRRGDELKKTSITIR